MIKLTFEEVLLAEEPERRAQKDLLMREGERPTGKKVQRLRVVFQKNGK